MTAQGEDILAWTLAAITGLEEAARAVGYSRIETGEYLWGTKYLILQDGPSGKSKVTTELPSELAEHAALNDPESVLRRCTADRKMLELHGGQGHSCPTWDEDGDWDETRHYNHEVCLVILALAEGYGWAEGER